jgi:hypothetical protein
MTLGSRTKAILICGLRIISRHVISDAQALLQRSAETALQSRQDRGLFWRCRTERGKSHDGISSTSARSSRTHGRVSCTITYLGFCRPRSICLARVTVSRTSSPSSVLPTRSAQSTAPTVPRSAPQLHRRDPRRWSRELRSHSFSPPPAGDFIYDYGFSEHWSHRRAATRLEQVTSYDHSRNIRPLSCHAPCCIRLPFVVHTACIPSRPGLDLKKKRKKKSRNT